MPQAACKRAECLHCQIPLPPSTTGAFCCTGCEAVHALLAEEGLETYYTLGGGAGYPVVLSGRDHKWLEPIAAKVTAAPGLTRVVVDVQGVHCAACVWLLERLFQRRGGASIVVNPAVGRIELVVDAAFPLEKWIDDVESFGYRCGPPLKSANETRSDLVWRMGVCVAIAMNTMIFGVAAYCGLAEGDAYRLFHALDFGLSFVSVLVGGTVFFRSAWGALRRRVLHLDLPIALGIALVFASSTFTYFQRGGATSYFDTLNVFIALMLVGRFLQERVLAKNRALLLASEGAEGLLTRRIDDKGVVSLVRCTEVEAQERLLVGLRDLVPVDATLLGDRAAVFSLDWISGESAPRTFQPGETIPAGAFSHDERAVVVQTNGAFDSSTIVTLLARSSRRDDDLPRATTFHRTLTRSYVTGVLAVAVVAFVGWFAATRDLARTLDVVAAVLIVTCPCAFGIAAPLAYELAQAGLRRVGLFVRTPGFLDRAAEVERVVFDKTGTLTTGRLVVADRSAIEGLAPTHRALLATLASRSAHPKSRAVADAVGLATFDAKTEVREIEGKGMELVADGLVYRLGAPAWAVAKAKVAAMVTNADVLFTCNGVILAELATTEELRPDARDEIDALVRDGYEVFVLSGDTAEATRKVAARCGVDPANAFGARTPEGKAAWLASRGAAKTLFVGDGINDSLVAEAALCAGTPAIDRPFMAARTDFYFVTPGLAPIRFALATAKRLARVVRRVLVLALAYNAVTLALALSGFMTPLLCAVLMPLSSLSTVLAVTSQLRRFGPWKS